jgi:hypothetical protein
MSRVDELIPGDLVTVPAVNMSATFVARTTHPIWPNLQLVIWRLDNGSWSHDALDARQEVGDVSPANDIDRKARLRAA